MTLTEIHSRKSRRDVLRLGLAAGTLAVLDRVASAAEPTRVKFLVASPAILPLWSVSYLAEDLGFYREEGLAIERLGLGSGPQALTALLAGEGTANMSAPGELLAANARGQRVKVIESYTQFEPVYLVVSKQFAQKHNLTAESPLQAREAALKAAVGARLGITSPGSISDMLTRLAVKQVNLNPARDVSIVPLGNLVNVISAMSANTIEGGIVYSPMADQIFIDLGCVPLLSVAKGEISLAKRMQGQVLEARAEDVAARPEVFERIVRADLKALKVIKEEPDKARDLLRRTRFSAVREDIWPNVWQNQLASFVTPYVAKESLRAWIETGLIGGNPDPDKFPYSEVIDMRFVESGLKHLGWSLQRS